ncbi:MAG: C40 family peptidase [Neisseriaceae bacterium]|nr:C40 family peptidase [Neisseriaceae bacterium]
MGRVSLFLCVVLSLVACSSSAPPAAKSSVKTSTPSNATSVRISDIDHDSVSNELMLHSMSLIGTPYRFGGSNRNTGFDCSGMVQFVYRETLNVSLPRTARDMAAAGKVINKNQLKVGDLVFFNTNGKKFSHVGLYIGENRFIHAPSSKSSIKINYLSDKYYASRFTGARTFFVK